jgi:hypothetical protein
MHDGFGQFALTRATERPIILPAVLETALGPRKCAELKRRVKEDSSLWRFALRVFLDK